MERRERRSSFELIAEGMRRPTARVADVEEERPDPRLTDEEKAALEDAAESLRGDVSPAKLIGPQISKGPGWFAGTRVPDGVDTRQVGMCGEGDSSRRREPGARVKELLEVLLATTDRCAHRAGRSAFAAVYVAWRCDAT